MLESFVPASSSESNPLSTYLCVSFGLFLSPSSTSSEEVSCKVGIISGFPSNSTDNTGLV